MKITEGGLLCLRAFLRHGRAQVRFSGNTAINTAAGRGLGVNLIGSCPFHERKKENSRESYNSGGTGGMIVR
jgi:hypothetical protein